MRSGPSVREGDGKNDDAGSFQVGCTLVVCLLSLVMKAQIF